ncbi:MAG TPA: DUF1761 domain-containing protein [Gemmatimonadaceae bacterium]|nr:DUF1761 domain-containing protein [Gemmatimonadaceae bacterium]
MQLPAVNWLAVIVAAVVIFLLGGLWYSPVLFAKRWIALHGRTEEQMRADAARANMPVMYLLAFICALIIAYAMHVAASAFLPQPGTSGLGWILQGVELGLFCWVGFVLPTSFATALFSMKPRQLWMIDTGYNLVSFILAGAIIMGWISSGAQ